MNAVTGLIRSRPGRLGEQLLAAGIIDEDQLNQALSRQKQTGAFLGETLLELGVISSTVLGRWLESLLGYPYIDLSEYTINPSIARLIPEHLARRKLMLPFSEAGEDLYVAMADPLDITLLDELQARLDRRIIPFLSPQPDLKSAINRCFDAQHKAMLALNDIAAVSPREEELSIDRLIGLAEDAPIVRLVNSVIMGAIMHSSSDIHIEPQEHSVRVRYRIDGLLYDQMTIPTHNHAAVASRVKIISSLNIAEHRRPQDGRFCFKDGDQEYDIRVSVMPTIYGEKVVMRILDKSGIHYSLDKLGFFPQQKSLFESFIRRPYGMVLVTGPTGSGKTTTIYSAINQINDSTLNINTIEDPVEYHLTGINQVQVNPKINVTFVNGLRTLVRQDPDVIMVGEIRDPETAEIAIQAALTGHLVFSTLHTNDAPSSLVRLLNMGVEPFLISSAIIGVLGQRLVRLVCPNCAEEQIPSTATIEALGIPILADQRPILRYGRGCTKCNRGMRGRTAVFEVMPMSDPIREMVLRRSSASIVRGQAITEGMMVMRDAGMRKALAGLTTIEEVVRVLMGPESNQ